MIFDSEYYDNSLWLMIKADKENRMKIVEFIKNIPELMLIEIRECVRSYKHNQIDNYGFGQYMTSDKCVYCYTIDGIGNLIINKSIFLGDGYSTVMELCLSINDDLTEALDVGYLVNDGHKIDYTYVVYTDSVIVEDIGTGRYKVKYAHSKSMPEEIFLDNISDKKNVNKLIRSNRWRFWKR